MDIIVTHVRVVAHLSQDLGGGVSENYWSIYLLLEAGASIRMTMTADHGDPTGRLEFRRYTYQLTNSAVQYWDFPTAAGLLASYIHVMVYNLGRDRYMFSGGGSGCRFWW